MSIKQNGGVFGRNPTFNDVTIEGQLTFDGDIDINSDLTVDGTIKADSVLVDTATNNYTGTPLAVGDNTKSQSGLNIQTSPTGYGYILFGDGSGASSYIGQINYNHTTDKMTLKTAGNDRAVIDANGINVTGNVIIGTSGKGIDFSATAGTGTSELLDDYEEGVWTPTLVGAVSAGSYSVAVEDSSCKYTKVGRQVTVGGKFTFTVSSAGSGYAKIGGLPFATSATNSMTGTVRTKNIGLAAGTVSLCILNSTSGSATYFGIGQSIDNAASVFLDIAGISSTDQISMTLTYFT